MAFLFDQHRPLALSPVFHAADDGDDAAHVPESLWEPIAHNTEKCAINIAPAVASTSPSTSGLRSVTCWAILDHDVSSLSVPARWQRDYPDVFAVPAITNGYQAPTHTISLVRPVPLSEVIFSALSEEAYVAATADPSLIESWFFDGDVILRQGGVYNGPPSSVPTAVTYSYRVSMAAPVQQGRAIRGTTKLYISGFADAARTVSVDDLPEIGEDGAADDGDASDDGEFDIGEDFLAGSVLGTMDVSTSEISALNGVVENGHANPHAPASGLPPSRSNLQIASREWAGRAHALERRVRLHEDDCTVYVNTADLGRIGVLDGDWVIARMFNGSAYRLVQVHAADTIVNIPRRGRVFLSPQLLYNLCAQSGVVWNVDITLRPSPFEARRPTVPVARSVTIARVASAFSMDRTYQTLFLDALQTYFKRATRLVKQGDIIAVAIDTDKALSSQSGGSDHVEDGAEELDLDLTTHVGSPNAVVYFAVTNIEHSVPSRSSDGPAADMYVGATVGELGCWIDHSATRMVQTGIEHSRVPDVNRFLGLDAQHLHRPPTDGPPDENSAYGKLYALCLAALNKRAVEYHLQVSILSRGPRGVGKATVAYSVAQHLGIHLVEVDCNDVIGESDVHTEGTLQARFEKASSCSPCILLLRNIDVFAQTTQGLEPGKEPVVGEVLRECIAGLQASWSMTGYPVLLVGTTANHERVPHKVLSCFKHEVVFEAPGEAERRAIITSALQGNIIAPDVSVKELAVQTAALVAADLVDLVSRAKSAAVLRSRPGSSYSSLDSFSAGMMLTASDFEVALGKARASYSESIGAPKIPSVSWDDVGGLANVKADILDTIQLPLEHPELFADGLKQRSGVLLYGPPGTGKTLLAKAVATSCALNFFSVKGPELLNMYIGESEANVRRVFQRARDARPCVIFFDELDSVAPKRGNHGDSGGVMDRIVSQLLAELDGLAGGSAGADVFVIGATNRPDLLDPALLRPGRFDRMLYLGVSDTHAAQLNVLQALTRKFRLHPDLKLERIAERCPFHYTGADFYALCADALLKAMSRKAEELEAHLAELNKAPPVDSPHPYPLTPQYYLGELATPAETEVLVSEADFLVALRELVPSVTQAEMEHYARIRERFSNASLADEGEA